MSSGTWQPVSEPWTATALRTVGLALAIGLVVGLLRHRFGLGVVTALAALWFTLGGHFAELLFRNWLRPRFASGPVTQAWFRLLYWFVAGCILYVGAVATVDVLTDRLARPGIPWWAAGAGFIGAEFLVHLGLRARKQPNFYDGRG